MEATITIIALLCSSLATPNHSDCIVDRSIRHEMVGQAHGVLECQMAGMIASSRWLVRSEIEYTKVMCVGPLTGAVNTP